MIRLKDRPPLTLGRAIWLIFLFFLIASCVGCTGIGSAIIDRQPTQCASEAVTVEAMQSCQAIHQYHRGTLTDAIAQPLGTLENKIIHREHNHE